jgi:GNAT superfamily N-acetyltransferase
LDITYINHSSRVAQSWWERWRFVANWWRLYKKDPRWRPPYYPALRRALEPGRSPHLARTSPWLVQTEALPRRKQRSEMVDPSFERVVAASVVLTDPRRTDRTAYLALLHCINDLSSLKQHLAFIAEALAARSYHRLIGPTGLSPHLGSGLQQDYWHQLPPLHTPTNPPYLPELADLTLRPLTRSQLYHLDMPPDLPPAPSRRLASLRLLDPARLAGDCLPLLAAACPATRADLVPPDAAEAEFLLDWLGRWTLLGWLAEVAGQPVGFVLLQPDLAPRLHRAGGGRSLLGRLWLAWAAGRLARQGRILLAGVVPEWRGRGIGQQLLHQARVTAHQQGWQSLTVGPLPATGPAPKFLKQQGAEPRQTYLLYEVLV